MRKPAPYDVVICGGGLAGLTLARQLRRDLPEASVAIIDALSRPLPEAAFKVGESTVEIGAFYLSQALGLSEYLDQCHLRKLGLRYFFGNSRSPIENRPEFGLSEFPREAHSYQIDRGILETDLREFVAADGAALLEGCRVEDIELSSDGAAHRITYVDGDDESTGELAARWVVDATGRRRLLQRKLGLDKPTDAHCSAAWFRVEGRLDIADLVPADRSEWHDRVPGGIRYYSTNHLMGDGYWVWLIPLSSQTTSIGIVASEELHDFKTFNTLERAMSWFEEHEPALGRRLRDVQPLDFRVMRRYSYSSTQVFSADRWACAGEAGVFPDPFYSPGINLIGFANTITTEMIRRDLAGKLTADDVSSFNEWYLTQNDLLTRRIQKGYPTFGRAVPTMARLIWDTATAWGYEAPQMFHSTYLDRRVSAPLRKAASGSFFLQKRMGELLADWGSRPEGRCDFEFFDYLSMPFLREFRSRNLKPGKSPEELVRDLEANMRLFEELAQALFLVAVTDVMPECLDRFQDPVWVNAWAVSLDPDRWEEEGLFRPRSEPRDSSAVREQIFALLRIERHTAA